MRRAETGDPARAEPRAYARAAWRGARRPLRSRRSHAILRGHLRRRGRRREPAGLAWQHATGAFQRRRAGGGGALRPWRAASTMEARGGSVPSPPLRGAAEHAAMSGRLPRAPRLEARAASHPRRLWPGMCAALPRGDARGAERGVATVPFADERARAREARRRARRARGAGARPIDESRRRDQAGGRRASDGPLASIHRLDETSPGGRDGAHVNVSAARSPSAGTRRGAAASRAAAGGAAGWARISRRRRPRAASPAHAARAKCGARRRHREVEALWRLQRGSPVVLARRQRAARRVGVRAVHWPSADAERAS